MATTKKEIAKSIKTLIVLLKPLKGQEVSITLRNDSLVRGTIENVDADMNIELSNATLVMDPFYCTDSLAELKVKSELEDSRSKEEEVEVPRESYQWKFSASGDSASAEEDDETATDSDNDITATATTTTDTKEDQSFINYFMVKGSRIRHIDLPTDSDLLQGARCEIERIRNRGKQWTKRDIVVRSEAERSF